MLLYNIVSTLIGAIIGAMLTIYISKRLLKIQLLYQWFISHEKEFYELVYYLNKRFTEKPSATFPNDKYFRSLFLSKELQEKFDKAYIIYDPYENIKGSYKEIIVGVYLLRQYIDMLRRFVESKNNKMNIIKILKISSVESHILSVVKSFDKLYNSIEKFRKLAFRIELLFNDEIVSSLYQILERKLDEKKIEELIKKIFELIQGYVECENYACSWDIRNPVLCKNFIEVLEHFIGWDDLQISRENINKILSIFREPIYNKYKFIELIEEGRKEFLNIKEIYIGEFYKKVTELYKIFNI